MTSFALSRKAALFTGFLVLLQACQNTEKPLTKEEALAFGKQLEIAIEKKEGSFMDNALDNKELLKRVNISSAKDAKSIKRDLAKNMNIGTRVVAALSNKGSYKMVRHYEKDNVQHLLFRLYDQGKVNYHDLELSRSGGKAGIADLFIYLSGENFSATLQSVFNQLNGISGELDKWSPKAMEMRSMMNTGKFQEAKELFNSLPASIRSGRAFQITYLQICAGLSNEEYDAALREFERLYPDDKNIHLIMIDAYFIRNEYDKVIREVDALDRAVQDPLLDFHRGICYSMNGDAPKSRECFERLNKNVPDFEEGMLELIKAYLMHGDYEKAKPLVDRFKTKSEFDQSDLNMLLYRFPGYSAKYGG